MENRNQKKVNVERIFGKPFRKGESGNPNGRPKLPDDLRKAVKMTKQQFQELLIKYLGYNNDQLKDANTNPGTPALDRIVISVIANAIKKGDQQRLDFLMNRIIGKVKDEVSVVTSRIVIDKDDENL